MGMMGQTGGIDTMRDPYAATTEKSEVARDRPLARGEKLIAEATVAIELRIAELTERLRPVMSNVEPSVAEREDGAKMADVDPRSDHVRALEGLSSHLHELDRRLGRIIERIEV